MAVEVLVAVGRANLPRLEGGGPSWPSPSPWSARTRGGRASAAEAETEDVCENGAVAVRCLRVLVRVLGKEPGAVTAVVAAAAASSLLLLLWDSLTAVSLSVSVSLSASSAPLL